MAEASTRPEATFPSLRERDTPRTRLRRKGRFPVVNGFTCVDVVVADVRQLFDNRDPAPFHERDLDDDLVDLVTSSVEDIPSSASIRVRICIFHQPNPAVRPHVSGATVVEAFNAFFLAEQIKAERQFRQHFRRGFIFLLIGAVVITVFMSFASFLSTLIHTAEGDGGSDGINVDPETTVLPRLIEGITIFSWVSLWKPIEALCYDWLPLWDRRRLMRRVCAATVDVTFIVDPAAREERGSLGERLLAAVFERSPNSRSAPAAVAEVAQSTSEDAEGE